MGHGQIGFTTDIVKEIDSNNCTRYATPQDMRDFGFIPEFVGRFPIITNVEPLSEDDLVVILKEPKNAITKQK